MATEEIKISKVRYFGEAIYDVILWGDCLIPSLPWETRTYEKHLERMGWEITETKKENKRIIHTWQRKN